MMTMLDEVLCQCGFIGTLIIGGPDPELADRITSMIFHTGKTTTGQSFIDTYPDLEESLVNSFNTFAHKCLGEHAASVNHRRILTTPKVIEKYNPFDADGRIALPSPRLLQTLTPPPVTSEKLHSTPHNDNKTDGNIDMQNVEDELEIARDNGGAIDNMSAGQTGATGEATMQPDSIQTAEQDMEDELKIAGDNGGAINNMSAGQTGATGEATTKPDSIQTAEQDMEDELETAGDNGGAIDNMSAGQTGAIGEPIAKPDSIQTAEQPLALVPDVVLKPVKYINGMSPYEWERQKNIDRNQKLLAALDMGGTVEGLFGKMAGKGKENKQASHKGASQAKTLTNVKSRVT
jgi:hypothetical protein